MITHTLQFYCLVAGHSFLFYTGGPLGSQGLVTVTVVLAMVTVDSGSVTVTAGIVTVVSGRVTVVGIVTVVSAPGMVTVIVSPGPGTVTVVTSPSPGIVTVVVSPAPWIVTVVVSSEGPGSVTVVGIVTVVESHSAVTVVVMLYRNNH